MPVPRIDAAATGSKPLVYHIQPVPCTHEWNKHWYVCCKCMFKFTAHDWTKPYVWKMCCKYGLTLTKTNICHLKTMARAIATRTTKHGKIHFNPTWEVAALPEIQAFWMPEAAVLDSYLYVLGGAGNANGSNKPLALCSRWVETSGCWEWLGWANLSENGQKPTAKWFKSGLFLLFPLVSTKIFQPICFKPKLPTDLGDLPICQVGALHVFGSQRFSGLCHCWSPGGHRGCPPAAQLRAVWRLRVAMAQRAPDGTGATKSCLGGHWRRRFEGAKGVLFEGAWGCFQAKVIESWMKIKNTCTVYRC